MLKCLHHKESILLVIKLRLPSCCVAWLGCLKYKTDYIFTTPTCMYCYSICTGAIFLGECSLEPNIPIFLIVGGISGILKNLFLILESMSKRCPHRFYPRSPKKRKYLKYIWKTFNIIFTLFMLAWIIAGSYWIYHIYSEVMTIDFGRSSSDGRSCNELLYKFSFGILTSSYILLVLMLCCTCCCSCCLKTNAGDEEEEGEEEDRSSRSRESGRDSREGYEDNESLGGSLHSGGEEAGVSDQDLHVPPSEDHYWTHVGDGESSPNQRLNNESVVQPDDSTLCGRDNHSGEGARQNTCDNLNLQMNLTEYTNSPILSPPHRPHAMPFLHRSDLPETSNNLYTTENENGYSCTAV